MLGSAPECRLQRRMRRWPGSDTLDHRRELMGLRLPKAGKLDSCRSQLAVCKTLVFKLERDMQLAAYRSDFANSPKINHTIEG